jgi:hypothetical protein
MDKHLADVRRYDATAEAELVERIVKHLGVALRNPASAMVTCANEEELERVRENWCMGKLAEADSGRAASVVARVAETMSGDIRADRATFYYLCAKHLGRLDAL